MKTSENVNEIGKAMAAVQGEMKPAIKDSANPFFKSKYSNLTSVWDSIREPMQKHQIAIFQDVVSTEKGVAVTTKMVHSSGQWIEFGPLEIPLAKRDAQAIGSATSYAKRYALSAACGVVTDDDDDGEGAMNREKENIQKKQESKPKPKEPTISGDQVDQIYELLDQADVAYCDKVLKRLKDIGHVTINDIPASMYDMLVEGLKKNIELKQKREKENV